MGRAQHAQITDVGNGVPPGEVGVPWDFRDRDVWQGAGPGRQQWGVAGDPHGGPGEQGPSPSPWVLNLGVWSWGLCGAVCGDPGACAGLAASLRTASRVGPPHPRRRAPAVRGAATLHLRDSRILYVCSSPWG